MVISFRSTHAALHGLVCSSQGNRSSARKIPQHVSKHSAKHNSNNLTPSSHLTSKEKGLCSAAIQRIFQVAPTYRVSGRDLTNIPDSTTWTVLPISWGCLQNRLLQLIQTLPRQVKYRAWQRHSNVKSTQEEWRRWTVQMQVQGLALVIRGKSHCLFQELWYPCFNRE